MTRSEFIDGMTKVISGVFYGYLGDESFFTCCAIERHFGDIGRRCYEEIFKNSYYDGRAYVTAGFDLCISEEKDTARVFALQVFEQICLEEKLYEQF